MRALEKAAGLLHLALERLELLGVNEHFQIARVEEIDLRRQQRRADDSRIALSRHVAKRDRQQRAADAIADRRDFAFAGCLFDRVERRKHALMQIGLEILCRRAARQD